jgi:hypothetical protein
MGQVHGYNVTWLHELHGRAIRLKAEKGHKGHKGRKGRKGHACGGKPIANPPISNLKFEKGPKARGRRLGGGGSGVREGLAPETPARILRHHILEVLRELGGRARGLGREKGEGRREKGAFFECGVLSAECGVGGSLQCYSLAAEGVLRSDSPTGVWELGKKAEG